MNLITHTTSPSLSSGALARPRRISLAEYMTNDRGRKRVVPTYAGIMGVVEKDGGPLWYELYRRDLQPMVYLASRPESIFWALDVLTASITFGSSPRHVWMYFITRRPSYTWLVQRKPNHGQPWFDHDQVAIARRYRLPVHYLRAYGEPGTNAANESVLGLAGIAEQRQWGRHADGAHLLVIEDLADAWRWWSADAKAMLPFLLDVGRLYHIGVVAGLRYEDVHKVPEHILARFRWQVWGKVKPEDGAIVPAEHTASLELAALEPDAFWMDTSSDGWLKFYLPMT